MNEKIYEVLLRMRELLDEGQLLELKLVLQRVFEIGAQGVVPTNQFDLWKPPLDNFLLSKTLEGKSEETIKRYRYELTRLLSYVNKPVLDIRAADITSYLRIYKSTRNVKNSTLRCVRAIYSSFFAWLRDRDYVYKNPMVLVEEIKVPLTLKKALSDTEMEKVFRACAHKRDRALVEVLYSTAVRVSEVVRLNRSDLTDIRNGIVVFGKGAKERRVYLNSRAEMYLEEYLNSRGDCEEALFVGLRSPHRRLTKGGIETIIRNIGKAAGIDGLHPHCFRHTAITNALNRGMPIQEGMIMAGHSKPETTMRYCAVDEEGVKYHHKKYLSA